MKQERGVTLTSLCIYVIALIIILGMMSTFLSYFYENTNETLVKSDSNEQYIRFLAYFTKDINSDNLKTVVLSDDLYTITFQFLNGTEHEYTLRNGEIFYIDPDAKKQIALCTDVSIDAPPFKLEESNKIKTIFVINKKMFTNIFYIAN